MHLPAIRGMHQTSVFRPPPQKGKINRVNLLRWTSSQGRDPERWWLGTWMVMSGRKTKTRLGGIEENLRKPGVLELWKENCEVIIAISRRAVSQTSKTNHLIPTLLHIFIGPAAGLIMQEASPAQPLIWSNINLTLILKSTINRIGPGILSPHRLSN